MKCWRPSSRVLSEGRAMRIRNYSTTPSPLPGPRPTPRHLLSIADLTPNELRGLLHEARYLKKCMKDHVQEPRLDRPLRQKTVAMLFSKRSTRTRVSTEAAVNILGGHPLFLGKDDIQLGVNESLYDTAKVISSMVSGIVARVGPHSDVVDLAKDSSVPVINALSGSFHPMQTIADYLTIYETSNVQHETPLKIAWVGDANNVLFDLANGAMKIGVHLSVATPKGYEIPDEMRRVIQACRGGTDSPGALTETNVPEEAVKDADYIVTDTWVSMGQEEEKAKRLRDFEGFQVTSTLAARGGAKKGWKFMHCLPRHAEEVSDEVFYSPSSLVFPEAENRLWAALAVLEAFIVNDGVIGKADVS